MNLIQLALHNAKAVIDNTYAIFDYHAKWASFEIPGETQNIYYSTSYIRGCEKDVHEDTIGGREPLEYRWEDAWITLNKWHPSWKNESKGRWIVHS